MQLVSQNNFIFLTSWCVLINTLSFFSYGLRLVCICCMCQVSTGSTLNFTLFLICLSFFFCFLTVLFIYYEPPPDVSGWGRADRHSFYTNTTVVLPNSNLLQPQAPIVAKKNHKKEWEEPKQNHFLSRQKPSSAVFRKSSSRKLEYAKNTYVGLQVSFFFHLFAIHTTPGVWLCPESLVRRRKRAAGVEATLLPDASWRQTDKETLLKTHAHLMKIVKEA